MLRMRAHGHFLHLLQREQTPFEHVLRKVEHEKLDGVPRTKRLVQRFRQPVPTKSCEKRVQRVDAQNRNDNQIHEYDIDCAGTITCADPSANADVKAIIEANVESAKRIIRNNTLPIFHRTEWLRRHKNRDNLSNLNAEIDFTNQKIAKLVSTLGTFKKEKDRTYNSDDWFQWSEGRVSVGKRHAVDTSSRDIHTYGLSIGADKIKDEDRDTMYGYVFQYGNNNVDIGGQGTGLDTDTYSLALYGTKIGEDD